MQLALFVLLMCSSLYAPRTLLSQRPRPAPLQTLARRARLGHGLRCCRRWCCGGAVRTTRTAAGKDGAPDTASTDGGGWPLDRCPHPGRSSGAAGVAAVGDAAGAARSARATARTNWTTGAADAEGGRLRRDHCWHGGRTPSSKDWHGRRRPHCGRWGSCGRCKHSRRLECSERSGRSMFNAYSRPHSDCHSAAQEV